MGFFSKIKQNFNHGGVKVSLQAPASASLQDATIPVEVSITASDTAQTINRVTVEIIAESRNQSFNTQSSSSSTGTVTRKTVAKSENTQPFAITPGETKSVPVAIVMNAAAVAAEQLPEGSGVAQIAGALQKLQSVAQAMNQDSYTYSVVATVDVEGITLDPADSHPIQILQHGQIGGAINLGG